MTAPLLLLSVAENLVHRGKFCVDTGSDVLVDVLPLYEYQLRKFQVRFQQHAHVQFLYQKSVLAQKDVLFDGVCRDVSDVLGGPESHRAAGGNPGADG